MKTIGDLLSRDLGQKIEEIIKVNQADQNTVFTELSEYVATDRIKEEYQRILKAIAEAPRDPDEAIGIWVSGFFGSGKSSFAKNLGYVLANRPVLDWNAADLFKEKVADRRVGEYIDFIKATLPTEVIMFDVTVDRAVKKNTERITEIMYTVLLRELDYAEDYDVAELEIELESEGRLSEFIELCKEKYDEWGRVRKGAQKLPRASAILHQMDPATYPAPDSWARSLANRTADITVGRFVERAFELTARRRPGKGLVFIIDEVGQYVARSEDKIEDLRAVVEQFGKEGKNRVQAHKAVAPTWVIVTSQEKLDEVVAAIDSKRVQVARLQDRFHHRVDLAPADIREVATRRVLAKKEEAIPQIRKLFSDSQGQLNTACRLERTHRRSEVNESDFIQFYPYLPHFVEMSIDIMSGIRLQPGADKHLGGSNRTIIKQAYEMLVSERTAMAAQPVGALVTLDRVFELVEGNLSSEKSKDISDITQRFKHYPEDQGWAARTAKAICLLEFVRDLPRTEVNIAACLVDAVGKHSPIEEVKAALARLQEAQFVRITDEGWKLQTAQEKNWESERRGLAEPKSKEQSEIIREVIQNIFSEPRLKVYRYRDLKSFPVGLTVDGQRLGDEGKAPLSFMLADNPDDFAKKVEEARTQSRQVVHNNEIFWVAALTPEIDSLVKNLHASRQMVIKYDQMRAKSQISNDEAACLQSEKGMVTNYQSRLRDKVIQSLERGQGLFRGISWDAADLGKAAPEIFKKLFDQTIPQLYPKLEMGSRSITGKEAEDFLKAANLNGLGKIFYSGDQGFNLVVKGQDNKFVPNTEADVAREILDYLNREHGYGNSESRLGKALENHFGGLGYGWDLEAIKLVLAVLFRAGAIEISAGGKRFESYQEPLSRQPFTSNTAFRQALFTPAQPLGLLQLTAAIEAYENLTGRSIEDVEKNAIATAFRKYADGELERLTGVEANLRANRLPGLEEVSQYRQTLLNMKNGPAENCVILLADTGEKLKAEQERLSRLGQATSSQNLNLLRRASAAEQMWPLLQAAGDYMDLAPVASQLKAMREATAFYQTLPQIEAKAAEIENSYHNLYADRHSRRSNVYNEALTELKARAEWTSLSPELQQSLLSPLASRACQALELSQGSVVCRKCQATLNQLESDLAAVERLKLNALYQLQLKTGPAGEVVKVKKVRLKDYFQGQLDSEAAVIMALSNLQEELLKLVAERVNIMVE